MSLGVDMTAAACCGSYVAYNIDVFNRRNKGLTFLEVNTADINTIKKGLLLENGTFRYVFVPLEEKTLIIKERLIP